MHRATGWIALALALALASPPARADGPGVRFRHHDWLLVCDNTGTCRAAGYQSDGAELPVSVLLTRPAGPEQPVTAKVQIALEEEDWGGPADSARPLSLRINGEDLGTVAASNGEALHGTLSSTQTGALLKALTRDSRIEWTWPDGEVRTLSDHGAAAVLLKMDEVQGRIGTPGALMRRGTGDESEVLPPRPMPVIHKPATDDVDVTSPSHEIAALTDALKAQLDTDECTLLFNALHDRDSSAEAFTVNALSHDKRLVSAECWLAAYNMGMGYWVINAHPPYQPVLVTTDGSDYYQGQINAAHKGRGLGDCWNSETWTWDGRAFVVSNAHTTGLCRGFPGGAWELPTFVTDVREDRPSTASGTP